MTVRHLFSASNVTHSQELVFPWEGVDCPIHLALLRIPPGDKSKAHAHQDAEVWIVLSGDGCYETREDGRIAVHSGDLIYLQPFTRHRIVNTSEVAELSYIAIWWSENAQPGDLPEDSEERLTVITSTPPTPNGDLHLGHIAGPYIAADVLTRYLRLTGHTAVHVTGTDVYQSYVEFKANRSEMSCAALAKQYTGAIQESLDALGIGPDQFTNPLDVPEYVEYVQEFFLRLHERGLIYRKESPCTFCSSCGRYLFEVWIRGICPHCGSASSGNACEECGRPNNCIDLIEATSTCCGSPPAIKPLTRLYFAQTTIKASLAHRVDEASHSPRLRALAAVLSDSHSYDIPVSHIASWGIPVPVSGFTNQIIWPWFEMWAGYSFGITKGLVSVEQEQYRTVQFFGFDNAYYHLLLFPAVDVVSSHVMPEALICNEFYELDGEKFSTSREHAVWARELLSEFSSDVIRYYLTRTRPEDERTNFSRLKFGDHIRRVFDPWDHWLAELASTLRKELDGVAPSPGLWDPDHVAYHAEVSYLIKCIRRGFDPQTFSTRLVTRRIEQTVALAHEMLRHHRFRVACGDDAYLRTTFALQLMTLKALAFACAPLMPKFANRMLMNLGEPELSLEERLWTGNLSWVKPGTNLRLSDGYFRVSST